MASFPEKENNDIQNEDITQAESTIFSDPAAHRDTAVKPKKLLPKILAGVLSLAVLIGGTVAVVKLIPERETAGSTVSTQDTITVKQLDIGGISRVTVTRSGETAEIYCETVYKTAADESSESDTSSEAEATETTYWYLSNVAKDLTDSSKIEAVAGAVASISATKEITKKTAEECGLESPAVTAEVFLKDGGSYKVIIGLKSPDNSGYYLKIEGEDKIYLVDESVYSTLMFSALDFASTAAIAGFDSEITEFDTLTISGKNFPDEVKLTKNDNGEISDYYKYLVVSPQKRLAKNVDEIFSLYSNGISVSGAYAYDVSAASLKAFGLDNPDVKTAMTVDGVTVTFRFALQEDGNCAVVSNKSKLIHRVSLANLGTLLTNKAVDFYEDTLFLVDIDDISALTFKTKDKLYEFTLKDNPNADEEEDEPYIVTYSGERLKSINFQNFYRECISIFTQDHTTENINPTPDISFKLTFKEGGETNIIFTKVSTVRYQSTVDGVDMGKVAASTLNNLIKLAEKLVAGEDIE